MEQTNWRTGRRSDARRGAPRRHVGFWVAALCFVLAAFWDSSATAQSIGEVSVERIEVGLDGWYKVGEPTLLRVHAVSSTPAVASLVIECADVDGVPASFHSRPTELTPGKAAVVETTFEIGRLKSGLELSLVAADGRTVWNRRMSPSTDPEAELHPAIRLETPVWLTLASLPPSLLPTQDTPPTVASEAVPQPWVVSYESAERLPTSWRGYRPASLLILPIRAKSTPTDVGRIGPMSAAQSDALRIWVEQGGHLLLSVSDGAAWGESPVSKWTPFELDGEVSLRQFSNLESFGGKGKALRSSGRVKIPRLKGLPNCQVPVRDLGGAPIIATVPMGFGRVSAILLDIESPPLSDWAGLPIVISKIAGMSGRPLKEATSGVGRKLTQKGVADLATQWNQTQEDFPEIRRPSYWLVMVLILATVLVIGPLDYLLAQRLFRRPELTWITFPLLAVACVFLGSTWGGSANGRQVRVNQIDVIDVDAASGTVRGNSWIALYSPEHERYRIELEPTPPVAVSPSETSTTTNDPLDLRLAWTGSPETGIGGIYREPGFSTGGSRYSFGDDARLIENLPILKWSARGLRADWRGRVEASPVDSRLRTNGFSQVSGTLTHNLPGTLEDCLLVVGGWAYFPKNEDHSLPPGAPWQPSGGQSQQRELRAFLTGERRVRYKQEGKVEAEIVTSVRSYDSLGRDASDILRMISFHQAAGGGEYTGLNHAGLPFLELTPLTQLGRGVLIGRLKRSGARLRLNGEEHPATRQTTFVRLVVPVEQMDRVAPNNLPKLNDSPPPTIPEQADPGDRNSRFD